MKALPSLSVLQPRVANKSRRQLIKYITNERRWKDHHAEGGQLLSPVRFSSLSSGEPISEKDTINDSVNSTTSSEIPNPNLLTACHRCNHDSTFPLPISMAADFRRNYRISNGTLSIAGYSPTGLTSGVTLRSQSTISTDSQQNSHNAANDEKQKEKKENAARRRKQMRKAATGFKDLVQKYGWTFVGTYAGVYFTTLGTLFVAINWGWMDPPSLTLGDWGGGSDPILEGIGVPIDEASELKQRQAEGDTFSQKWVIDQMRSHEWTAKYADKLAKNPNWINLGVAWIAVKFTEPLRLGMAIAITPRVARFFGKVPKEDVIEEQISEADEQKLKQQTVTKEQKAEDEMTFSVKEEKIKQQS